MFYTGDRSIGSYYSRRWEIFQFQTKKYDVGLAVGVKIIDKKIRGI
jgi:hypothetical protein